ncbi:hypothetical protein BDI4_520014 [Burkholderia diffusa]|nr:hypothetical protein BDI4_520014 [Burkholderia diffusa]
MFAACRPFGPVFTSNSTFWFSCSVLKPSTRISEKCANRSSPPPSGVMKPKPFASLNHLTVPVAMLLVPKKIKRGRGPWVRKIKEGGNGTNRSTVDGRTTKEPIHSPLEILQRCLYGYSGARSTVFPCTQGYCGVKVYKPCKRREFFVGAERFWRQLGGATVKLRAAWKGCPDRVILPPKIACAVLSEPIPDSVPTMLFET